MYSKHLSLVFLSCIMFTLFGAMNITASSKTPPQTEPFVDLNRYIGTWYEIGRTPTPFQNKCGASRATYTTRDDNRIDVLNECLKKNTPSGKMYSANAIAKVIDKKTNAKLKVNFIPILKYFDFLSFLGGDYWVLKLDQNYQYVLVGSPDYRYFWILSRTPTLPIEIINNMLNYAKSLGFDISQYQTSETWPNN